MIGQALSATTASTPYMRPRWDVSQRRSGEPSDTGDRDKVASGSRDRGVHRALLDKVFRVNGGHVHEGYASGQPEVAVPLALDLSRRLDAVLLGELRHVGLHDLCLGVGFLDRGERDELGAGSD